MKIDLIAVMIMTVTLPHVITRETVEGEEKEKKREVEKERERMEIEKVGELILESAVQGPR